MSPKNNLEYYRPISLTCFCCKLPENIAACCKVRVMVFNATVNNIAVISSRSVLLVEEAGVPEENHRPATSH